MTDESTDLNRTWAVGLDRAAFEQLSADEGFHAILALGRLVNMLQFATFAVYGLEESGSPFARRQSMISFAFSCALLYEAYMHLLPRLGKHYGMTQAYREGLGAWRGDPDVQELLEVNCKPFRHTTVFHVDIDAIAPRLARIEHEWPTVLASRGTLKGYYYYELADDVALMAFLGEQEKEGLKERIIELAARTAKHAKAFLQGADSLIGSIVSQPPYRLRQAPDTQEPAWVTFQQRRDGVVPPEDRPPRLSRPG